VTDESVARTTDPDGQEVVFDDNSRAHLSARRPDLLQYVDVILTAVSLPDYPRLDPEAGGERFYRQVSSTAAVG
jgi:hypothetical protein